MQSTMGSQGDEEPSFGVPLLTIVSGLAIAVAAVVGLGGPPDLSPSRSAPEPVQVPFEARNADPGRLLVYLVGSEEEKRALLYDISTDREWFVETYAGEETAVQILVLADEGEESLEALAELLPQAALGTGMGPEIKLVDMR